MTFVVGVKCNDGIVLCADRLQRSERRQATTQLTDRKGPDRRRLDWWMELATSSLPVPVGPLIRTFTLPRASSPT